MSSSRTAGGGGESTWGATVWADDDEWEDVDAVAAVATTTAAAVAEPASTKEAVPPEGVSGSVPLPPPREGALPGEATTRNEAGWGAGIGGGGLSRLPTVVGDDSAEPRPHGDAAAARRPATPERRSLMDSPVGGDTTGVPPGLSTPLRSLAVGPSTASPAGASVAPSPASNGVQSPSAGAAAACTV